MARARSGGGSTGSIWGLVLFGAGFFISMILAIVFYTKVEAAEQAAEAAQSELNSVRNSADSNDPAYTALTAEGSGTAVRKLLNAVGERDTQIGVLQSDLGAQTNARNAAEAQLQTQTEATQKAQADLQQTVDAKDAQAKQLTAQVTALESTVSAISQENTNLKSLIDSSIEDVVDNYDAQINEWKKRTSDAQAEASASERTVIELRETIEVLRGKRPEDIPVTLADATVVAQIPDQNKIYLDIGRDANLRLGMAFQVYDAGDVVKIEDPQAEGKAVVEVININSNSAIARIVQRKPRAVVNDGDILVNVVYDPNRLYSFHVFGQFDLNYDGDLDENGNDKVRSLVTRFDGLISEELDYATDYLVLGIEPVLPDRPEDELDLIKMREFRTALENYQAYQDLISKARELGVPVLNQNRFLDLIGYFER
ncbi:hypothetical protein [Algisphaera agarilytica]|uniref:Uncharacterized protein YceH (UPF0502 family) n=1 Tax=Algisphaera agarilytica TaxID=1385975 RepID=A0A7X0H324_9BACT|nr:hypothetical protein [Algisphaera agarilytica]MBB6428351.1 uncharacterized protein YceH (UPF0502 family) [Algisphaera agarilytica]